MHPLIGRAHALLSLAELIMHFSCTPLIGRAHALLSLAELIMHFSCNNQGTTLEALTIKYKGYRNVLEYKLGAWTLLLMI
jgi:hypothetical protein